MSVKRSFWIVLLSGLPQLSFAGCLDSTQLETLQKNELNFMLNRIPPAFANAVQDQQLTLKVNELQVDACTALLVVNIPEAHIKEAQTVLAADTAKTIMLAAQGYAIPNSNTLQAAFKVMPANLEIPSAETLQTGALGQLRASVELMYSLITQERASLPDNAQNTTPWSMAYQQRNTTRCSEKYGVDSGKDIAAACACQAHTLAKHVSERQMEYIDYVRSNPYAIATGSSQYFGRLESETLLNCGLSVKK